MKSRYEVVTTPEDRRTLARGQLAAGGVLVVMVFAGAVFLHSEAPGVPDATPIIEPAQASATPADERPSYDFGAAQ